MLNQAFEQCPARVSSRIHGKLRYSKSPQRHLLTVPAQGPRQDLAFEDTTSCLMKQDLLQSNRSASPTYRPLDYPMACPFAFNRSTATCDKKCSSSRMSKTVKISLPKFSTQFNHTLGGTTLALLKSAEPSSSIYPRSPVVIRHCALALPDRLW